MVKDFKLLTTDYVTLEFLVKSCNTSDCYGTLISYTKVQTFSIRHSSEVSDVFLSPSKTPKIRLSAYFTTFYHHLIQKILDIDHTSLQ